jgi:AcrR family transcriptional regulator
MNNETTKRQQAILQAALTAFGQYGFARTTMEDIALASGVARTAIYKEFRNKEHIFRTLAERVHGEALEAARRAFAGDGVFTDRLEDALIDRDLHLLLVGHSGPHADEIADLYLSLAGDLAGAANRTLVDLVAKETRQAVKAGIFKVPQAYRSERDFAHLLRLGLEGVKKEVKSPGEFKKLARQLIRAMT